MCVWGDAQPHSPLHDDVPRGASAWDERVSTGAQASGELGDGQVVGRLVVVVVAGVGVAGVEVVDVVDVVVVGVVNGGEVIKVVVAVVGMVVVDVGGSIPGVPAVATAGDYPWSLAHHRFSKQTIAAAAAAAAAATPCTRCIHNCTGNADSNCINNLTTTLA